jgi:hypothetical protein
MWGDMAQRMLRHVPLIAALALCLQLRPANAGDPDPKVMEFRLPKDLQFKGTAGEGAENIVLFGDPDKPGMYGVLTRWGPHKMSRPHFHPNDRYVYVVSGTWWLGWGTHYDPAGTYPVPAGTYVRHFAKQIHYDGAKDQECVIYIVGMGPATATPAEQK